MIHVIGHENRFSVFLRVAVLHRFYCMQYVLKSHELTHNFVVLPMFI